MSEAKIYRPNTHTHPANSELIVVLDDGSAYYRQTTIDDPDRTLHLMPGFDVSKVEDENYLDGYIERFRQGIKGDAKERVYIREASNA